MSIAFKGQGFHNLLGRQRAGGFRSVAVFVTGSRELKSLGILAGAGSPRP